MRQSLANIRKELESYYSTEEIQGFIQLIFHHLKGYSLTDIVINQEEQLLENEKETINEILISLKKYIPIQYILGTTEFYELYFEVNADVLIPRPETEELVDWIVKDHQSRSNLQVFDACTGSGCIAISLAKHLHNANVLAADISTAALAVAQQNALRNTSSIQLIELDMLQYQTFQVDSKFDIIVSNPPYVLNSEKIKMQRNVLDNEPHLALFVDDNEALIFYEAIAEFAKQNLDKEGSLYFEINEAYASEVSAMLMGKGFICIELRQDVFKKDIMIKAKLLN